MFRVEVTKSKTYWFNLTPDNGINRGGFFCEVFADNTTDFKLGEFTINRTSLPIAGNLAKAAKFAEDKIKREFR